MALASIAALLLSMHAADPAARTSSASMSRLQDVVLLLTKPSDDEGSSVSAEELRKILDDPRSRDVYRPELVKYATPRSVKIQNAEHKSFLKVFLRKDRLKKGAQFL